jgi:hypothetical protein
MAFLERRLSPHVATLAVAVVLAFPLGGAGWIALRPPADEGPLERRLEPDVFETELEPYDWGAIQAGDWVEYDVATASRLDTPTRVRTRLACVGIEDGTAWVESRDHIVSRLFPGTVVLCRVERASGRISAAWWGPSGGQARSIEVRRLPLGTVGPGIDRRGRVQEATLSVGGRAIPATRTLLDERGGDGAWWFRMSVWLSPEIPFPRRACVAAGDQYVSWEGSVPRGGVAREEYSGLTVRMTTEVVAWGTGAKRTVVPQKR